MNDEFIKDSVFVRFNPNKPMDYDRMETAAKTYKHPKRHKPMMLTSCDDLNRHGGSGRAKTHRLRALREQGVDRTPIASEERLSLGKALSEKDYS